MQARARSSAIALSRRSMARTIICACVGATAVAGCSWSGAEGTAQAPSLSPAPEHASRSSSTPLASPSPTPRPSASATILTLAPTDAAVADGDTDLCIQAASRESLGFPVRQVSPTSTSVANAIRGGFVPGLTSLPAADGQRLCVLLHRVENRHGYWTSPTRRRRNQRDIFGLPAEDQRSRQANHLRPTQLKHRRRSVPLAWPATPQQI